MLMRAFLRITFDGATVIRCQRRKKFLSLMAVFGLLTQSFACVDQLPVEPTVSKSARGLLGIPERAPDSVFNRYIVVFRTGVLNPETLAQSLIGRLGGAPIHTYRFALKGFNVANLLDASIQALKHDPNIAYIEEDLTQRPNDIQYLPLTSYSYQQSALWDLDRVDERQAIFDGQFQYSNCGAGVHIYIVDSGVRGGHDQWGYGRIGTSATFLSWSSGASPTIDQLGHGTEVAGVAAGVTYGIAKCATIHSVRINDNGSAYVGDIIAGLDWVAGNHESPAVANLSYGDIPGSFAERDALQGVVQSGVVMVKSAGNDGVDAYQDRGNRAVGLIVAGASTPYDSRALFSSGGSNFGPYVSLFAPGYAMLTAGHNSNSDTITVYGTSFAAPITVGAIATYLARNPLASPATVKYALQYSATTGVLTDIGSGSPNKLLYAPIPDPPGGGTYSPIPMTINGPTDVRPGSSCLWGVSPGSAADPVAYTWTVGEATQSTSEFLRYAAGSSSFLIELHGTDANGLQWYSTYGVTVRSDAPVCLDT